MPSDDLLATTTLGTVFFPQHAREQMTRHGIGVPYVHDLIDRADKWKKSGNRVVAWVTTDGIEWRIVLHPEADVDANHEYDAVTIVPETVDVPEATASGRWDRTQVLNLKFYSQSQ